MMMDLFSSFDFCWGSSPLFYSFVWLSGIIAPTYSLCYMIFWLEPSKLESGVMVFMKEIMVKMPNKVKAMVGGPHLMGTLMLVLLIFNTSGVFPYSYPIMFHFIASFSFAFPFWLMTFIMNFNFNWKLFLLAGIRQGGSLVPTIMAMVSELVSLFARPITLTCRLSMNVMVGQIVIKLLSSMTVGLLYPFIVFDPLSFVSCFIMLILTYGLLWAEVLVAFLQAFIFVQLLVFYINEVPIKPE